MKVKDVDEVESNLILSKSKGEEGQVCAAPQGPNASVFV